MREQQRVFITGLGALSASGETLEEHWQALLKGETGIAEITQWDISSWSHRLGGELKAIQPAKMLPDRKLMKVISRQDVFGINAAVQAVSHSQMMAYRENLTSKEAFDDESGVFVGSPGNKYLQQYDFLPLVAKSQGDMQKFAGELFNEVHPMWLLRILPNNVLAYTGITYGFKGSNHNITNHAVGGAQAIIEAWHAIKTGQVSRVVVVGYDIGTEPQALYYYEKLGVLSKRHLKPFDKEHDGTILAEGAAALVLESEESVKARSATCYAELVGACSATESAGLFSIEDDGIHLARLIETALKQADIAPTEVDFLVAHANGNQKSDASEACAISQVFDAYHPPVTGFKWSMGHTLCASGVLDTVLATWALRNASVPGIANLTELADCCAHLNVSAQTRSLAQSRHALLINRGFASMNACLVIKACE